MNQDNISERFIPSDIALFGITEESLNQVNEIFNTGINPSKPGFNLCEDYMQHFIRNAEFQTEQISALAIAFGKLSLMQHDRMIQKGFYKSFHRTRALLAEVAEQRHDQWIHRKHNPSHYDDDAISEAHISYQEAQKDLLEYTTNFMISKIGLIHEENSEAISALREGNAMDDKLEYRRGVEVELADAVIRILDFAGCFGLDIGGAIRDKMEYNSKRPEMHGKNA